MDLHKLTVSHSPYLLLRSIDYEGDGNTVSCLVRVSYTLFYPVMSSFGYPYLIPASNSTTTTSSIPLDLDSVSFDENDPQTESERLLAGAKKFQSSSFVKEHPEIISGRGNIHTTDHNEVRRLKETVQSARLTRRKKSANGKKQLVEDLKKEIKLDSQQAMKVPDLPKVPLTSEVEEKPKATRTLNANKENDKENGGHWIPTVRETSLPYLPQSDGVDIDISSSSSSLNHVQTLNTSSASPTIAPTTSPTEEPEVADDDYTEVYDDSRLVFGQCNIVAYLESGGSILSSCGK